VLSRFGDRLADATCTESADLTTANPATTPANDAIAALPRFAFTPQTDRDTIAPDPHRRPLITVAGTMDALLPIDDNARAYARRVAAASRENANKEAPAYRLYEVQNGNHIETFKLAFPQLELIQPHAQRAFDLLISTVENHAELPPSQCIPRGGTIDKNPAQPGHCPNLLAP
jgi:hypothetical protein